MTNIRKVLTIIMSFAACVACFGLAACGSDNTSSAATSTPSTTSAEVATHVSAERLEAPADAQAIATELVGEHSDVDFTNARATAYANATDNDSQLCQVYLFSADGTHDAYVAFEYDTKTVHGMDIDHENVIAYDTLLMSVL